MSKPGVDIVVRRDKHLSQSRELMMVPIRRPVLVPLLVQAGNSDQYWGGAAVRAPGSDDRALVGR